MDFRRWKIRAGVGRTGVYRATGGVSWLRVSVIS
jgi:hypothetical protein